MVLLLQDTAIVKEGNSTKTAAKSESVPTTEFPSDVGKALQTMNEVLCKWQTVVNSSLGLICAEQKVRRNGDAEMDNLKRTMEKMVEMFA